MRRQSRTGSRSFPAALILALLATGCGGSYTMVGTLSVSSIYYDNPSGLPSTLQFALSATPEMQGGYKSYTDAVTVADATSSAGPSFEVTWEAKDPWATSREFWLLVAEDTDSSGVIDMGDFVLPSMRVVLSSGSTTTISGLVFDTASGIGALSYNPIASKYMIRLFVSDPSAIGAATPVRLRFGTAADLSDGSPSINFAMAITDPDLVSGYFAQAAGVGYGIAIFDADSSGATTSGVDWVSAPDPGAVPPLNGDDSWMLWPGMLAP